jgi:hypothetical protein
MILSFSSYMVVSHLVFNDPVSISDFITPTARVHSWILNCKEFGNTLSYPSLIRCPDIYPEALRNPTKNLSEIIHAPAEIRAENLPKKSQKRYDWAHLLGIHSAVK